jgi:hypothetical protein
MRIVIETIPHEDQRYPTVGDWWVDPAGTWQIRVSELSNEKMAFLVGIHELVEMACCLSDGVTEEQVDAFDKHYQGEGEPGADPDAPYFVQHHKATSIEETVAGWLDVDWHEYDKLVERVYLSKG